MSAQSRPPYWDVEVATLSLMLERGMWSIHELSHIRRQIEDRKAQIMAGLGSAEQLAWTLRLQIELDPNCRVRRDPVYGWMLDRFIEDEGWWHPVGYIGTGGRAERITTSVNGVESETVIVVEDVIRQDLIPYLRAHDMQRPGYIEEKRAAAEAVRKENERKATEKVLLAVDSLSTKQLENFIEVEKAIQTGETVTMHGESYRMFEKMTEAGKTAPPGPQSANPGAHPQRLHRDYSEGEGEAYGNRHERV